MCLSASVYERGRVKDRLSQGCFRTTTGHFKVTPACIEHAEYSKGKI